MNESIKELLSSVITDEMIIQAVREVVWSKLDGYEMSKLIEQTVSEIFREKTEAYIRERVDAEFAKPVKKDDGWGGVEYYDSFEEFVRKSMQLKLSNNWNFRQEVDRKIEKAINNAKKRVAQKVAETDFVDEVLAELKPKDFQF